MRWWSRLGRWFISADTTPKPGDPPRRHPNGTLVLSPKAERLPRLLFTSRRAPSPAEGRRLDVAYGIRSREQLDREVAMRFGTRSPLRDPSGGRRDRPIPS